MMDKNKPEEVQEAMISVGVGTAIGASASAVVGGMGLAVGGTALGVGMAPVAAAGAVVGTAVYGTKKAIEEQDATAIGAAAIGAGAGAGISALVGGMGLAVGGTAVAVTMAPVAAVGAVIGLGLKEFYTDAQGNTVENPRYLSKSEKRLKKAQRRLSKQFRKGKKQSKNYHKQRVKVAKIHLKVSRQRKDKAIKDALALVQSNDLVVYEALKVRNLVKNRQLAKSISDASWYQFTEWLNYFAKIYRIV